MPLGRPQSPWEGAGACPGSQERCPGRAMTTLEERVALMPISVPRPRIGLVLACAALFFLLPVANAAAAPVPVDLRVVDTAGQTMAEQVQFTSTVSIETDPGADCFGPPGGSGDKVTLEGPTALGAVADASEADADLRPISVTDQFSFGLGLCGIGGREASGSSFWYLKHNHAGAQVGGDQLTVSQGDDVLWYLTPSFPPPPELELVAPAQVRPGEPYQVTVFAYDDAGTQSPAAGATVTGAAGPTGPDGTTTVTHASEGLQTLQATRGADIPSNVAQVSVTASPDPCTLAGEEIIGTARRDKIDAPVGPDTIMGRAGDDRVRARDGCADTINCGKGRDKAKVDAADQVARCNRVKVV
jgi:hypothetical protein